MRVRPASTGQLLASAGSFMMDGGEAAQQRPMTCQRAKGSRPASAARSIWRQRKICSAYGLPATRFGLPSRRAPQPRWPPDVDLQLVDGRDGQDERDALPELATGGWSVAEGWSSNAMENSDGSKPTNSAHDLFSWVEGVLEKAKQKKEVGSQRTRRQGWRGGSSTVQPSGGGQAVMGSSEAHGTQVKDTQAKDGGEGGPPKSQAPSKPAHKKALPAASRHKERSKTTPAGIHRLAPPTVPSAQGQAQLDRRREGGSMVDSYDAGLCFFGADSHKEHPGLQVNKQLVEDAWRRYGFGGEIDIHHLFNALQHCGHRRPERTWVKDLINSEFGNRGHLDLQEYRKFMSLYQDLYRDHIVASFMEADVSETGELNHRDVTAFLRSCGITPVPGVVDDIMVEISGSRQATITVDKFCELDLIIKERMGFTEKETAKLALVFKRFDKDEDGHINSRELHGALLWMGFVTGMDVVDQLCDDAETDNRGEYNEKCFLQVFRAHREHEIRLYARVFGNQDKDVSGSIDQTELDHVFEELGYLSASPKVIGECREKVSLSDKKELLFEDLFQLLEAFRESEGFSREDLLDVDMVFRKFANDHSDGIGGVQLSGAMRWLGHPATIEEVIDILHEYDLDDSGNLELSEFRKLVAKYRENEIRQVRRLFQKHDEDGDGHLTAGELRRGLLRIGYMPGREETQHLVDSIGGQEVSLDIWGFSDLIAKYRKNQVSVVRENCGFSDLELKRVRRGFSRFDPKDTGFIRNKNLAGLLAELFPEALQSVEAHEKVRLLIKEVDTDGDGAINLMDYLKMMRITAERKEEYQLTKQRSAIQACKFSRDEVIEFRKVFQGFDCDASGDLSVKEFQDMISSIVAVPDEGLEELKAVVQHHDEDGNRRLDFPEFLRIMRKLLDTNWRDIRNATQAIADKQSQEQPASKTPHHVNFRDMKKVQGVLKSRRG